MSAPDRDRGLSRRQALAELVLFGNPVRLGEMLSLDQAGRLDVELEHLEELHQYRDFYLPDEELCVLGKDLGAQPGSLMAYARGEWAGWTLFLHVQYPQPLPDTSLDDATRSELRQLVDEPADGVQAEIRAHVQALVDEAGRFIDTGQFPGEDPEDHSVICDGPDCTGECCEDES